MNYKLKIIEPTQALKLREQWKIEGQKVIFTNGCFDILHRGHIDYLNKASELGNKLIVAVNSDNSVKKLKGENRPIQDEVSRTEILASLSCVDAVVVFDDNTPYELIKLLKPDVLVKGSDYKVEEIVGYDILKETGGEVKLIEYLPGYSTSLIEKKIKSKNQ
ncbi:MAG: D-glycero-beta-D-manno-heptose 1-phosphate adenylyltransferase [Bacteroidetes bacterium]|nr:D-glycero-beta-D-manno-heptose 1-phosphate adenylyltransferase [Bacteroidota bacterium]